MCGMVWNGLEIQRLSDDRIKVTQIAKIREMAREYRQQLAQRFRAAPDSRDTFIRFQDSIFVRTARRRSS